jgi:hypothetical protein
MKTITFKPGTIILWKEYSKIRKWFNKLLGKKLDYNRGIIIKTDVILYYPITQDSPWGEECALVLEPIVDYTKQEAKKLQSTKVYDSNTMLDTLKIIVNTIRPGSVDASSTFDDLLLNKEYKVVYDFSKKN